jgi:hypothetical protein
MGFPVFQIDSDRVKGHHQLFADGIDEDAWVIFHGTSGFNCESIERDGFDSTHGVISAAQIRRVAAVFERMKWFGDDRGGYPVLKPFSLDHDFQGSDKSRLFFAETSMKALLYATREFSGGEKLRALRRAFNDLETYLNDPRLREQHRDFQKAQFNQLSALNASRATLEAVRPVEIDLAWLRRRLADLSNVRQIADEPFRRHDYGAVYALRMTHDDVGHLHWNKFMGIETTARISPSKIIGKGIVPAEYEWEPHGCTIDDLDRQNRGLFVALTTENGQRRE